MKHSDFWPRLLKCSIEKQYGVIQTERYSLAPDVKNPFIFSIEEHKSTILQYYAFNLSVFYFSKIVVVGSLSWDL